MRLRWILFASISLAACAVPVVAQSDAYRHCMEYPGLNLDFAIQECSAAIQSGVLSEEQFAYALNTRGTLLDTKGDYHRAIQDFDQAIRLKPDYAQPFNNRGLSYAHQAEFDRAIRDYNEAIRLKPDNPEVFSNRGNAFYRKGEYDRAIQNYDQGLRLKPDYAAGFYNRGLSYSGKRQYDRAIQDFDQAIRLKPDLGEAFYARGLAFYRKGEYDRAIQDYDQAIRLRADDAEAFLDRGRARERKSEFDLALQDYDQAIRLSPDLVGAFYRRGSARFNSGQFAAAQSDFAKALQLNPAYPYDVIWLYLAQARAGQDTTGELSKNAAQIELTGWPGQIISLYLGKMTPESVLAAAKDADPKKDREHDCETYFYLGEHALLAGKEEEARRLFQQSVDTGVTNFDEYTAAQAELKRLAAANTQYMKP